MTARYLTITEKHRQDIGFHSSLADFSVEDGETLNPEIVRDHPNISLYCLDDASKQAIFVELPPEVDLAKAPFVYQAHYGQAQRLVAMPYDTFQQLASTLPAVEHLIMIYITGRSGSTLLSHLFNALDGVLSLSEPDVASHFVHMRSADGSRDGELRELLDSTVRFLSKPTATKTPKTLALKLRNEGTQVMDLYQATVPQVKNLFLYRDAIGFVRSFYRLFKLVQVPQYMPISDFVSYWNQVSNYDYTSLTAYLDAGTIDISIPQQIALWWLATIEWYLAKYQQGLPVLAVRYDDLNTHREQAVTRIFEYCGVPATHVHETLHVFERDAQADTILARENPHAGNTFQLTSDERDSVIRIIQRHPVIQDPDFVVPGTLQL
jgi:hypothetical protein